MEETGMAPRLSFESLHQAGEEASQQIHERIVGQRGISELLLVAILADGHVLLEGNPGVAKTLMAKILSKTLDVKFSRIQFTPDLMPSDVIGTTVFNQQTARFEFKPGPVFANVVLIDEINRAPAKTQAALFEAMQEKQVTVDGHTYTLDKPFLVLATQNPIEQEGTYRLPEAQLDRFLFKLNVDYPDMEEEVSILERVHEKHAHITEDGVKPVFTAKSIQEFRSLIHEVKAEPSLLRHIAEITLATRNHKHIMLGASPRASLAMLMASKALAAMRGRDYIIPDDIHFVALPILRHRIQLSPEKEMEGLTTDQAIKQILQSTEVPR